jgi:hypothetical protein
MKVRIRTVTTCAQSDAARTDYSAACGPSSATAPGDFDPERRLVPIACTAEQPGQGSVEPRELGRESWAAMTRSSRATAEMPRQSYPVHRPHGEASARRRTKLRAGMFPAAAPGYRSGPRGFSSGRGHRRPEPVSSSYIAGRCPSRGRRRTGECPPARLLLPGGRPPVFGQRNEHDCADSLGPP